MHKLRRIKGPSCCSEGNKLEAQISYYSVSISSGSVRNVDSVSWLEWVRLDVYDEERTSETEGMI